MRTRTAFPFGAALVAAFIFTVQPSAQADTFGTSGNEFTIDFVSIGNPGNAADTTGYGAVVYEYRIGKYEISQDQIDRATASGMANISQMFPFTGSQPAASINWYEAAAFVNWLNTSSGKQAAYNLTWNGSAWSMSLWSSAEGWQLGGENLYRHSDAYYFLPSENEWYKAAYYNPKSSNYFIYPTASDAAPTPVANGTNAGTAVYLGGIGSSPAPVTDSGGLSPYGTMGQAGNVYEWMETASDGVNSFPTEDRVYRGGSWSVVSDAPLQSSFRLSMAPELDFNLNGFRVASIPEPSTYALLLITGAGALWWSRRRR